MRGDQRFESARQLSFFCVHADVTIADRNRDDIRGYVANYDGSQVRAKSPYLRGLRTYVHVHRITGAEDDVRGPFGEGHELLEEELLESAFVGMDPEVDGFTDVLVELVRVGERYLQTETCYGQSKLDPQDLLGGRATNADLL
jgi:hypothetical protein